MRKRAHSDGAYIRGEVRREGRDQSLGFNSRLPLFQLEGEQLHQDNIMGTSAHKTLDERYEQELKRCLHLSLECVLEPIWDTDLASMLQWHAQRTMFEARASLANTCSEARFRAHLHETHLE